MMSRCRLRVAVLSGGVAFFGTASGRVLRLDLVAMAYSGSVTLRDGGGTVASGLATALASSSRPGLLFFGTDPQSAEQTVQNVYFGPSSAASSVVMVSSALEQLDVLTLDSGYTSVLAAAVQDGRVG